MHISRRQDARVDGPSPLSQGGLPNPTLLTFSRSQGETHTEQNTAKYAQTSGTLRVAMIMSKRPDDLVGHIVQGGGSAQRQHDVRPCSVGDTRPLAHHIPLPRALVFVVAYTRIFTIAPTTIRSEWINLFVECASIWCKIVAG